MNAHLQALIIQARVKAAVAIERARITQEQCRQAKRRVLELREQRPVTTPLQSPSPPPDDTDAR
jgi:hypothetical protein